MNESNKLDKWTPKELALNQPMTLEMHPQALKQFEDHEKETQDKIKNLQMVNQGLTDKLDRIRISVGELESYKLHCVQVNMRLTILQCAGRIRRGQCRGCPDRNAMLENLFPIYGTKPRNKQ